MKIAVSAFMVTMILVSMLVMAFEIRPAAASATIIVPDDCPTIQEAIDSAIEGDTVFVRAGTYYERLVLNESISLIGEDRSLTVIDGSTTAGLALLNVKASNTVVSGFTVQRCASIHSVLVIINGHNNTFADNILFNDGLGMGILLRVNNSIVQNNILRENTYYTMRLENCNNNTIQGNTLADNLGNWGIHLINSSDNQIRNNHLTNSTHSGINLGIHSYRNLVERNVISTSTWGIYLTRACDNVIRENTAIDSSYEDIFVRLGSSGNDVYHNNFTQALVESPSGHSKWDDGYPSGGNYWRDYTGVDANSDGIGDSPYVIDQNNTDRYPLMAPYNVGGFKLTVRVADYSTGEPLSGAVVVASGLETRQSITYEGNASFLYLRSDSYVVSASKLGYITESTTVELTSDTKITLRLLGIPPQAIPEAPLGAIAASASMIVALVVYVTMPRWRRKRQLKAH